MTRHSVKIEQLDSGYGVYWNVDDEAGHLAIEGSLLDKPLFLLRSGVIFRIIQFDSMEWANEWLDKNRHHWEEIVQVEDLRRFADTVARAEVAEADADRLAVRLRCSEQTIRNLGNGALTGDYATIALNEAANIRAALAAHDQWRGAGGDE